MNEYNKNNKNKKNTKNDKNNNQSDDDDDDNDDRNCNDERVRREAATGLDKNSNDIKNLVIVTSMNQQIEDGRQRII